MAPLKASMYLILSVGLIGAAAVVLPSREPLKPRVASPPTPPRHVVRRPVPMVKAPASTRLDEAPPEVLEFLRRVREKLPEAGARVEGYQFQTWDSPGKPTREAVGLKRVEGLDPEALIARVMDVNGYPGHLAHVEACRSIPDPASAPPAKVRVYQTIRVPGVADVQQEIRLVDAGTIKGYRVVYWYLLKDATNALDRKAGARSEFNVGAWLAAPGVAGYALSTWPRRDDVNALQWFSLTSGANALARKVVEENIDGMAAWAAKPD